MSIADEIQNYANGLSDAYDAVNDMSGIIPQDKNMNNLDTAIRTIPQSQGTTYTAGNGIDITNDVISIDDTVVAELADLDSYVTLATNQNNITGEKTFVGDKRIKFKGVNASSKLGFTMYDQNNAEVGFLEATGQGNASKKNLLGIYDNSGSATRTNYLGFQYYNTHPGSGGGTIAYNLVAPPLYRGVTSVNSYAYIPVEFTDGDTTVKAGTDGIVDISTLLPSVPSYIAGTGIDITNDTISVDNTVAMAADLPSSINSTDWSALWQ